MNPKMSNRGIFVAGALLALSFSGASLQAQNISVSPKLIPFPNQGIHSTSSATSITLWNNQTGTLSISSIKTAAPYTQTNNCGTSMAANAKCTINVTFGPTAVQYYSSTLTITDSAGNSPQVVTLTGNGVQPVKYTPVIGGYYFNHQIVNTPSTPQAVTVTNQQSTTLTFTGITSAPEFPFTTNCGDGHGGGTLAAGATCTVQVTFDPQAVTTYNANLAISDNAYGSPIVIPLTGTGISGTAPPTLVVTPVTPCILPSRSQQFSTTFISNPTTAVNWYVDGVHNGNSSVGTITAAGLYTAPAVASSHTIRAVSQTTTTLGGNAHVSITTTPSLTLDPYVASVPPGGQQTYQALTCNAPDTNTHNFEVDGILGGNSTVGTITPEGVYTAPTTPGLHTVRLTDTAANKTTAGEVTVYSGITADFALRANNTQVIPASMFGYGRGESLRTASDRSLLTDAGVSEARLSAQITLVFATSTPDWTKIDPFISTIQAAGQHAMLQLNQSPTWLQPTSGSCVGNAYSAPTNNSQWAQIAADYVAHMDATFPGVVTDYEIWNEPNSSGMCAANHLASYLDIYAAAAPAMKTQAARDAKTIRVGGPVLSGFDSTWFTPFLTNSGTAPYIDFVSYHQYFGGTSSLDVQWENNTGMPSLYDATQNVSTGAMGDYKRTQALVAAGAQPGKGSTPIYVTEYNTNWAFFQDCCKNNPTYAPVFNELYLTDMLDTVYNGVPIMPAKLFFFAGSAYPYFCLIGVKNGNNDCLYSAGATPVPYPQYYAFDLLASPTYLGLVNGGHMAKTISPPSGGGGTGDHSVLHRHPGCGGDHQPHFHFLPANHGNLCQSRIHRHAGNALFHRQRRQDRCVDDLIRSAGCQPDDDDRRASILGAGYHAQVSYGLLSELSVPRGSILSPGGLNETRIKPSSTFS